MRRGFLNVHLLFKTGLSGLLLTAVTVAHAMPFANSAFSDAHSGPVRRGIAFGGFGCRRGSTNRAFGRGALVRHAGRGTIALRPFCSAL